MNKGNKMKPCKHLDHDKEKYPSCELIEVKGFSCPVFHFRREAPYKGAATDVQFCGEGRGRIAGIFQCYNPNEMSCHSERSGE